MHRYFRSYISPWVAAIALFWFTFKGFYNAEYYWLGLGQVASEVSSNWGLDGRIENFVGSVFKGAFGSDEGDELRSLMVVAVLIGAVVWELNNRPLKGKQDDPLNIREKLK